MQLYNGNDTDLYIHTQVFACGRMCLYLERPHTKMIPPKNRDTHDVWHTGGALLSCAKILNRVKQKDRTRGHNNTIACAMFAKCFG